MRIWFNEGMRWRRWGNLCVNVDTGLRAPRHPLPFAYVAVQLGPWVFRFDAWSRPRVSVERIR